MPQVNQAIGNTYDTITRPVVFGVAQDCLKQLGFDKNAYLSFKGFTEVAINQNNTLEAIESKNFFGTDTIAEIQVKEQPKDGLMQTISVFRPDEMSIFRDELSNIYMRPVKQITEAVITFKLRFHSQVEAFKWRDDIIARLNLHRVGNYHRVTYSYPIPPIFMTFLWDAHELIAQGDPTEEQDFANWFFKYADKRTTTLTNMNGADHMVVIPETQVRVLGLYDHSSMMEEPEYDKDDHTWKVEWSYTFTYDKVIECVLYYELIIRQQLIKERWFGKRPYDLYMEEDIVGSQSNQLHEHHLPDFNNPHGIYVNREPMEDTWYPVSARKTGLRHYTPAMIVLTALAPDDNRLILNLNEMSEFDLLPSIKALIEAEHQYVTIPHESLINVTVFGDNVMANANQLTLDADLNLRAVGDLNRTPVYRVVISVINDLTKLSNGAQDRNKNHACLTRDALMDLFKKAGQAGLIPKPDRLCRWTDEQWNFIVDILSPPSPDRPWHWGWPPVVPGVDFPPGWVGDKPRQLVDSFMSIIRSVGLFQIVAARRK